MGAKTQGIKYRDKELTVFQTDDIYLKQIQEDALNNESLYKSLKYGTYNKSENGCYIGYYLKGKRHGPGSLTLT